VNDRPLTLNALFERSVARRGDALAVKDGTRSYSYRELDARAAALAHELQSHGLRKGDAVVIHADRTADTVVAVVAVLKAGGVFVPVSLDTPAARLELILADANASMLLVDRAGREGVAGRDLRVTALDLSQELPDLSPADAGSFGGHAPPPAEAGVYCPPPPTAADLALPSPTAADLALKSPRAADPALAPPTAADFGPRSGLQEIATGFSRWDESAIPPARVAGDRQAPFPPVTPHDLAYIIYTSGTSGQPKGIMIEHGSIACRYHDWEAVFGLARSAVRLLQVAKLGFDVFVGDVVKVLGSGGVLVMCPGEAVLDPARLHALLVGEAIDYVDIVPAVLRHLLEHLEATGDDLACLGTLNVGADLWTKDEYARARRVTRVPRLFNSYGVTEVTVENTLFEDDGTALDARSTLPIGSALPSDTILLLDDDLNPVAPGQTGQICIGGPCVARGYVNRPELNERAFFERDGVRFYKTGDLGRADANGVIEFLGRIDFQVKINGYRIELEEIERVLEQFPTVRQAVVCYDSARRALTAFVRTVDGTALRTSECSAHLTAKLPSYMVPARFVVIDAFPLNQNGKVDRVGLTRELAAEPKGHDLHESRSLSELQARLERRGLDLLSLVNEFVKPTAPFGLRVTGALANGTATEASPLELLVLLDVLDGAGALKKRKRDVAGCAVQYDDTRGRATLTIDGLEIALDFALDGDTEMPADGWTVRDRAMQVAR
jgi:amino acid adenylation domain-containing protein